MTFIYVLIAAVAGFVAGILVGRKNPKTVNSVVSAANAVVTDVKKV